MKVMLESDDSSPRKIYTPLTEEEAAAYNILVHSPNASNVSAGDHYYRKYFYRQY